MLFSKNLFLPPTASPWALQPLHSVHASLDLSLCLRSIHVQVLPLAAEAALAGKPGIETGIQTHFSSLVPRKQTALPASSSTNGVGASGRGTCPTHYHKGGGHDSGLLSVSTHVVCIEGGDCLLQVQDLKANFRVEMLLSAQKPWPSLPNHLACFPKNKGSSQNPLLPMDQLRCTVFSCSELWEHSSPQVYRAGSAGHIVIGCQGMERVTPLLCIEASPSGRYSWSLLKKKACIHSPT